MSTIGCSKALLYLRRVVDGLLCGGSHGKALNVEQLRITHEGKRAP